jgi:uncharacterized membrane protein YfcA
VEVVPLPDFVLFVLVGFAGQLVDGALGMAYGVICSTFLLSAGVAPAAVSASVHAAEVFTTAASGISHLWHGNVDKRLFMQLAPAGILGGIAGAYFLTGIEPDVIRPIVVVYLGVMGAVILLRVWRDRPERRLGGVKVSLLAGVGGYLDAMGGGGWGPVVAGTLVSGGGRTRHVIGTVNAVEFLVTVAASATFVWALLSGHWREADGLTSHAAAVGGLIVGGLVAAPLAGYATKIAPRRLLTAAVGVIVVAIAIYQSWQLLA